MTTVEVLLLLAGALSGGFVNGLAGFGTALFALGWWLQIMTPAQAVAIVLVMSVVSGVQGVVAIRKAIDWRRLARFLIPALLGIPLGLNLLQHIDAGTLKVTVAGFMMLYGGFFLLRSDLPNIAKPYRWVDIAVGYVGGVLGAMAGLSGALPTMWVSMRDWTKQQSRAVLQPYNLVVLGIAAFLLALEGGYDRDTLVKIVIALPATMIAAQIGLWVFKRLTDYAFRRLLIILTCAAGPIILARELALIL